MVQTENTKIKVSVALCTYKADRRFLTDQLESLRHQSKKPDEVIIYDDGSNDGTAEFTAEYIEKHHLKNWKAIKGETNLGYVSAFRKALSLTTGDIIYLCDQDDMWQKRKVEKMTKVMRLHPKIEVLACSFSPVDEKGEALPEVQEQKGRTNNNLIRHACKEGGLIAIPPEDLIMRNIGPGCSLAIRRKTAQKYLQQPYLTLPHDWALNLISAVDGGLYFYNEKLLFYRLHDSNTIGLSRAKDYETRLKQIKRSVTEKKEMLLAVPSGELQDLVRKALVLQSQRASALERKNLLALTSLLPKTLDFDGLYKSILYDCSLLMRETSR